MKKALLIGASLVVSLGTAAQTLNVVVGEVTYKIPASQAGSMDYADGSRLTILGKTFQLNEVTRMYVDHSDVADNSVSVTYNGSAAAVTVAGNCMSHLDVTANGSAVSIVQDETVDTEISYSLSGASDNGSFYMDGHYKATVVFDNLSLTCADSAAVNIENGKRIAIQLVGESTLKDSKASQGKGALMVNGHSEFDGDGTLNLYGYAKHAYWADEYVQLKKKFTGTINILYAKKDGLNVNQYFLQNGGHFNVSGTLDDGIQVSADDEEGGYATISGGSLTIDVTAAGSKGLKCDGGRNEGTEMRRQHHHRRQQVRAHRDDNQQRQGQVGQRRPGGERCGLHVERRQRDHSGWTDQPDSHGQRWQGTEVRLDADHHGRRPQRDHNGNNLCQHRRQPGV